MSVSLQQKLEELKGYLSSSGKKVVLIGEDHTAENMAELYEIVGKTMKIISQPKIMAKKFELYLELPRESATKVLEQKDPNPVGSIQGNIVRFLSMKGVEPNYPMFDRRQCSERNELICRNGDQQYAADIKKILENTDIVIGIFGLGHLHVLSELLGEFHPFAVNITTPRGISMVEQSWDSRYPGMPMPDFHKLYPMVIDNSAASVGRNTIDVWYQEHKKPPRINQATASGMRISELKHELTLRHISFAGMVEKSDFIAALVNWKGGKVRRSRSLRRKHIRRKGRKTKQRHHKSY
jgi:hypothetical protein